jgi:hypothetical protein
MSTRVDTPITLTAENQDGVRHQLRLVAWTPEGCACLLTQGAASYEADPRTGQVLGVEGQAGIVLRLVPGSWRRLKELYRAHPRFGGQVRADLSTEERGALSRSLEKLRADRARLTEQIGTLEKLLGLAPALVEGLTAEDLVEARRTAEDPQPQDLEGLAYTVRKLLDHVEAHHRAQESARAVLLRYTEGRASFAELQTAMDALLEPPK